MSERLNPTAIDPAELARVLSTSSGLPVTETMIQRDIADGAPANADGTINLIRYAAWLVKSRQANDGD